jgi:hypothetical protein
VPCCTRCAGAAPQEKRTATAAEQAVVDEAETLREVIIQVGDQRDALRCMHTAACRPARAPSSPPA